MNINIQQAYWPVGASGMAFAYKPLLDFVDKLTSDLKMKKNTAEDIYGCRGFVAHGFVDSVQLNGGLLGDPQWSLCVTCGAWLSLSLWEYLVHSDPSSADIRRVFNIFRRNVLFFVDYIWENEASGYVYTGPTTSPENSYRIKEAIKLEGKDVSDQGPYLQDEVMFLAFSPAIDISVLRQISNVFSILVSLNNENGDDLVLAKRFGKIC